MNPEKSPLLREAEATGAASRRSDSPHELRQAFELACKNIKCPYTVIGGMYPRFSDQIGENTQMVREILL